jgi:hypothetical protein
MLYPENTTITKLPNDYQDTRQHNSTGEVWHDTNLNKYTMNILVNNSAGHWQERSMYL